MDNNATATATLGERVAEEVRALMARRRMSGRKLADLLGVSPSWVSYRMTGVTPIGLDDLQRIAEVLNVEVADLLPFSREGRTVVVAGDARRQTTVAKAELPKRSRLNGLPTNSVPKASTRRPVLLVPAHA